ncbi:MaoC/PaaZ C-terminal domain-containing protein [Dehalococcoides mccartyi]|nr:MaoC/PaaZ C-terminal domain-containing protein [Dehalococcoides mccartyi]
MPAGYSIFGMTSVFENITEGQEIACQMLALSSRDLVIWAGASGDYNPIHYDKDIALKKGLGGVVVPGQLVGAMLGSLASRFARPSGRLAKLSVSYKKMMPLGENLVLKGIVSSKADTPESKSLSLKLWAEDTVGDKTVTAAAVILY